MEALLFRHLIDDIRPMVVGRRLDRIFAPQPGMWTFRLQASGHPRFFLFSHHPATVALTLAAHAPENPAQPTAQVMRLRKHVQGLRIHELRADWVHRRLLLGLGRDGARSWLTLDAQRGVGLAVPSENVFSMHTGALDLEADLNVPVWPSWEQIRSNALIWQSSPQISPLLRRTLEALPEERGRCLLDALQSGHTPSTFFAYRASLGAQQSSTACPWPLPRPVRQKREEIVCSSALEAASILAEDVFFPPGDNSRTPAPGPREIKRRSRLRHHLDADEQRMRGYSELAGQAETIRQHLYQLPGKQLTPRSRVDRLCLVDADGQTVSLDLDGRKSILENMQHWFRLAEKGRRGLTHVQNRRAQLEGMGQDRPVPPSTGEHSPARNIQQRSQPRAGSQPDKQRSLPLHRFLSSDGFVLLRGKNQRANHHLLTKVASPFDFWLHAADGPGAHLILKRDAPGQAIPKRTLEEAAGLAGLASHFASSGRATVICALVKHVRPVKGAPGMATVDQIHQMLHVTLDPDLENMLLVAP